MTKVNKMGCVFLFLSCLQFVFIVYALASPQFITGNFTAERVTEFANPVDTLLENTTIQPEDYIDAAIGIFKTVVNGTTEQDNREGLKVVLGFLILSVFHSVLNVLYSFNIAFPKCFTCCCEGGCDKCCEYVRKLAKQVRKLAKNSFTTGIDTFLVTVLFDFTAEDLFNITDYGASFVVLVLSVITSAVQGGLAIFHANCMSEKKNSEDGNRAPDISLGAM